MRRASVCTAVGLAIATLGPLAAGGCAVERPALSSEKLAARKVEQLGYMKRHAEQVEARLARRMAREAKDPGSCIDILIISGGGDYGAFGAGFLQGWGWSTLPGDDGRLGRPSFDVVTGVSTGALIAPFAFIGTNPQYDRVAAMYSSPKKEWFVSRGLIKLLFGAESYMDTAGLKRELEAQFDDAMIAAIAAGEQEDRTLWIGTTNLDLGVMYPWDLTTEARRIVEHVGEGERPGGGPSAARFRDVLLASAAIPAVFPPVVIDSTLYVDGGTTSNILFDTDLLRTGGVVDRFHAEHPGSPLPRLRYWVIINNKLGVQERVVQPTWLSITEASVATAIRSSTLGALKRLETLTQLQTCRGLDVSLRFVCIPDAWKPPTADAEPFDPQLMQSLLELGRRMGEQPDSWRTDLAESISEAEGPAK
jgi:predicted acylesterase/phospholipase RssA